MSKKVSIPFYEGMKLNVTVEKGFLVAEYSDKETQPKGIQYLPIGSIFEHKGECYLVCEADKNSKCNACSMHPLSYDLGCNSSFNKCEPSCRKDKKSVFYRKVENGYPCMLSNGATSWMVIFKDIDSSKRLKVAVHVSYQECSARPRYKEDYKNDSSLRVKFLSEEECEILFNAMHKDGKDWDVINKQIVDYVEPIKVGDICILWDDDDESNAIIDKVVDISFNSLLPYTTKSDGYKNAIRCESLEQYKQFKKSKK